MALAATRVDVGRQVRAIHEPIAVDANATVTGAGGAATTLTITAPTNAAEFILIERIDWSYSAAPTGGALSLTDGASVTYYTVDITSAGPGTLEVFRRYPAGAAATVVLAAPGGAVVGKLNVSARIIQ